MEEFLPAQHPVGGFPPRGDAASARRNGLAAIRHWLRHLATTLRSGAMRMMPRPDRFEVVIAGGRSCSIRRNPGDAFGLLLRGAPARALAGTRGLLTATDLLVWQNGTVFHDDVERATGLRGLHLVLRNADVGVSLDALDPGMGPPWLLPAGEATRREAVTAWLRANPRLAALYPEGFGIDWYEPWPGIDAEGLHAGERRPAA